MVKLYNRVKVLVSSTGTTQTINLGSAVTGYQSFTDAGVPQGTEVAYVIENPADNAWEYGVGTYNGGAGQFTRNVTKSSVGGPTDPNGGRISLSSGAYIFISAGADELYTQEEVTSQAVAMAIALG